MPVTIQPATLRYKANGEYLVADSIKGDKGDPGRTGATPQFNVGSIATGEAGSDVSVTITGTAAAPVLNMSIPKGDKGDPGATPNISIGTIETGAAGTNATVAITGTPENPVLNMSIPRGFAGPPGAGNLIAPDYYELEYPVSKGQHCIHDGWYYEANDDIATSESWTPAHWTKVPTIGDEIGGLAQRADNLDDEVAGLQNHTAIEANDKLRTFHELRDMTSVEVHGNENAFSTVHFASGINYMPVATPKTDSGDGLSVTFDDRFITITGAETANHSYRNTHVEADYPAGNYTIVMFANGTYTNAADCYFEIYGKRDDGTSDKLKSMYFNGYTYRTWSLTTSYDYKSVYLLLQGRNGFSVTGTLKVWFGLYSEDTVITDTEEAVSDGETVIIDVNPADYINGIDTMQHKSIVTYHPTVQEYVELHEIDINDELTYTTPEAFGAVGNNIADDTSAINQCIAHALSKGISVRGFRTYKTTGPISILGNNFDIYIKHIRYTGNDYAVYYQGSWSKLQFGTIESSGDGMYLTGETANMHYNTFIVGTIDALKNGIHIHANRNIYSNYVKFDYIAGGSAYSCIYVTVDPNTQTGYSSEWHFIGGRVDRALWGIRGCIGDADEISVYSEGLGTDGNGGAIWSEFGSLPRINYVRTGEIQNHNTVLKISGTFVRKQSPGGTGVIGVNLDAIDITELTLPEASELVSENTQIPTNFIIHNSTSGWVNLTKNLIIWGNRFQFPQFKYVVKELDGDLDMTDQYYQDVIPQKFIVNSTNARVDLHPTYATNCLGVFTVEQRNGYKIDVYDYCGNMIFDGSDYPDGTYRLTSYIVAPAPGVSNRYALLYYNMSNQCWDIERMPEISTQSDFQEMLDDYFGVDTEENDAGANNENDAETEESGSDNENDAEGGE